MAEINKKRAGQRDAEAFRKLPDRAQEIWFQYCDIAIKNHNLYDMSFIHVFGIDYSNCKSPIEVIFNLAYDLVCFTENYIDFRLTPQFEVNTDAGHYYLDFGFLASDVEGIMDIKNPDFKLAIECDGYEFHERTKEQVAKDNEREYNLKMQGFDILRFSGSQIYNKPFRCAIQTLKFIQEKIGEEDNGDI